MFPELAHHDKLFDVLYAIDVDLAELTRGARCPRCGGPLHWATYERKPRGGPEKLPDEYLVRLGLCCGRPGCRCRVLPASTLFMGRRVYWGGVVLVVLALRQQRPDGYSARRLRRLCGVSRKTLGRWMTWFAEAFPRSSWWQSLRGRVGPWVLDHLLPRSLLMHFVESHGGEEAGLIACLLFLATGQSAHQEQAS